MGGRTGGREESREKGRKVGREGGKKRNKKRRKRKYRLHNVYRSIFVFKNSDNISKNMPKYSAFKKVFKYLTFKM